MKSTILTIRLPESNVNHYNQFLSNKRHQRSVSKLPFQTLALPELRAVSLAHVDQRIYNFDDP